MFLIIIPNYVQGDELRTIKVTIFWFILDGKQIYDQKLCIVTNAHCARYLEITKKKKTQPNISPSKIIPIE